MAILITGYDDAMREIGDKTSAIMRQYAGRHGMQIQVIRKYSPDSHPSWQKVDAVVRAIQAGHNVLWMDADTVITNMDAAPWKQFKSKLNVSRDWGYDATEKHHFSMGNFFANRDSLMLFSMALKRRKTWANQPLWEQSCFQEMYRTLEEIRSGITIHPRRTFNAVPIMAQVTAQEPWQKGDWLAHLTGISNEERMEIFERIKP